MKKNKVKDIMAAYPVMIEPESTLQEAAKRMEAANCGVLPVGTKEHVVGVITDRDIITRAIAKGKNPVQEKVSDFMTGHPKFCSKEDTLLQAAELMKQHKISRLVVKDDNDKVCGILSFGTIFRNDATATAITGVVEHTLNGKKAA